MKTVEEKNGVRPIRIPLGIYPAHASPCGPLPASYLRYMAAEKADRRFQNRLSDLLEDYDICIAPHHELIEKILQLAIERGDG